MFSKIFGGNRPDITPAQVVGGAFAAVGPVCVLLGVHLSKVQLGAVDDLKLIALGLIGADAAVRIGRNLKDGKVEAAALSSTSTPPDTTKTVTGADTTTTVSVDGREVAGAVAAHVPEEAPLEVEEIESLPPEVSSDPEADAIDAAALPSDDEEAGSIGPVD